MSSRYFTHSVRAVFFLALPLMGACSFAGQMAKDSVEGATSYYSEENFTLVATIPANFGFTSKAKYSPKKGEKCEVYSPGLGGNVIRQQQKSNTTDAKNVEQTASTNIPLEYHIADCSMELTRVSYELSGRYGTGSLDRDLELAGGLSIRNTTSATTESSSNLIEQRGICTWYFQISTAKIKRGEVEKVLSCEATGPEWEITNDHFKRRKPGGVISRSDLQNKSVHIEFRLSPLEEPYYRNYWIKLPSGWKPCTGRWNSSREELCTSPPQFRTFKLNGRECSVYPGCDE
jgi:hypothetical protein